MSLWMQTESTLVAIQKVRVGPATRSAVATCKKAEIYLEIQWRLALIHLRIQDAVFRVQNEVNNLVNQLRGLSVCIHFSNHFV